MEQSMNPRGLSRRQFLQVTGSVSLVALLAACAPGGAAAPAAGGSAASAPAAQGAQEINFLVRPDIRSAYAADAAVEAWAKDHEATVKIDEPAGAADTKIQAAMAAGDLPWDGFAVIEGPWAIESWVSRGLVQPLDDLIAVSKEPDAAKVVPAIIPSVLESSKYQGKQYTIPGNVGSVALGWFWAPLKKAEIDPPTTWDEVRAAAEKIKATSPELTPYDSAATPLCDQIAMIWGGTKTPLTKDGLIDWQSEISVAALEWQQKMVKDSLMPAVHTDSFNNWLKGGTAIMTSYDVHGTMAQQTFGVDAATTGLNITKEKGDPAAGAPFWLNGSVVLQKAANAQGMMDFLLWWFGPSNSATGKQIATVAAKPAYQYTYDEFIKNDPVQKWQLDGIELVRNSVPFPANLYWNTQNTAATPWIQKALDPANNLSAADALAGVVKDIEDQISKMKS